MRLDSGWFGGGFGVGGHWTRNKLGGSYVKKTHRNHGSRHGPTAAMVPSFRHRHIQQLANMLHDKSVVKLEIILVFTIY
jgi:hypothetical protein